MLGKLVATHIRVHERVLSQPPAASSEQAAGSDASSSESQVHVDEDELAGSDSSGKPN